MGFEKNNKFGAKKIYSRPLDKQIIGFRGYEGQREKLKLIPDWQNKLREYVNSLIEGHGE
ncbi:MAG: hypothetical protein AAFS12_07745 [Cyanobacteria bacterium J06632_19]